MIVPAQPADKDELIRLYRRNHPGLGRLFEPEATLEVQTFVAKGGKGRIIGLALVSCIRYGAHSPATIHELEPASGVGITVGRSLLKACLSWLTERGIPYVYVYPRDEYANALYRRLGFRECNQSTMDMVVPVRIARQTQV